MTYGIDECRRCGAPIKPWGPMAVMEHEYAIRQKPIMTKEEYRKAGFKASPTIRQTHYPHVGCCQPCAEALTRQKYGAFRRFWRVVVPFGLLFLTIFFIAAWVTW